MKTYFANRYKIYSSPQNAGPLVIMILMLSLIGICFFMVNFNDFQRNVVNVNNQQYLSLDKQIDDKQALIDKLQKEVNDLKDKQRHLN
jgi:cell division protein FtsL